MRSHLLSLLLLVAVLCYHTALAQVVAPSQGGEVGLVRVTATTMELSFGTAGNGQGRVVVIAATDGGPVPIVFTDNTFYTADAAYGQGSPLSQGYVVYNGTGHSATVTGLTPSTYYYIVNAEYNADNTTIAYNTRGTSISTSTRAASSNAAPLPVELTSFTGKLDSQSMATLHWSTATEQNTAYFALERSADGAAFTEAARIAAAGTSAQMLAYHWPDPQALTKPMYYRLRQTDRNGAVHYSSTVTLTPRLWVTQTIDVYPNPSPSSTVNLLMQGYEKETLTLRLTDAAGRLVMVQSLTPTVTHYSTLLPLPTNLSAGTYLLTLAGSGYPVQKRIVIAN